MRKNLFSKRTALITCLFSMFMISCSTDDNIETDFTNNGKGRFDNSPFVWDEVYSANHAIDQIFIGDLLINAETWRIASDSKLRASFNQVAVTNPVSIYVGAIYPTSSLPYVFDREIAEAKNPIDIIFDFKDPFTDRITSETGSIGYKKSLSSALNSDKYKTHGSGDKNNLEYYFSEFYTYKDLEKAFPGNLDFGTIFSAKAASNKKQTNIKGRILARLVSENFVTYMDTPASTIGFFKNPELNKSKIENPVYIKSLTYGKIAYVAIESEYSYSEVKTALKKAMKYKFVDSSIKADKEITEIFSKSSITVFSISDNTSEFYFTDALSNLNSLFTINYSRLSYGYLIYFQGRYLLDNSAYYYRVPTNTPPTSGRPKGGGE